jgi:SAM-dependent methyltransferase
LAHEQINQAYTTGEVCLVCGGRAFEHSKVLWPELVQAWELSEREAQYIDVQQGTHCQTCRSNVRSMALARAVMRYRGFDGVFIAFVEHPDQRNVRVLELNEAGNLHSLLRRMPRHQICSYPECDMTSLPFPVASFDMVIHSDTLEHVADPLKGLKECRRVLADRGALVFTVPVIVGRLSRSRSGLLPSYHGDPDSRDPGMMVHTEFGADVWAFVTQAGFSSCELVPFQYPRGLAIVARP